MAARGMDLVFIPPTIQDGVKKELIMMSWTEDFDLYNEVLKTIPLWVSFLNLSLNCWGRLTLSRIASGLETPLYADECTSNASRISYARVLIEMDISKELPKCIKIQDPSGKEFKQMVEYDWVPQYCKKCLMVGHDCERDQGRTGTTKRSVQNEQHQTKQQGRSTNVIGNIQQTRKPTTQWVEIGLSKQAERDTGKQIYQGDETQDPKEYQQVWTKAKGRVELTSPIQQVIRTTNSFSPLREVANEGKTWADNDKAGGSRGQVKNSSSSKQFAFTAIYGLHIVAHRCDMWEELRKIDSQMDSTWLLMGDFNAVLDKEDRVNGTEIQDNEIKDFRALMEDCRLNELENCGKNIHMDKQPCV
ncbi:PREDICTED: uncharacterized protein LOC109242158 [Nicotiana attenuata]|uniref:uncharacterized protein LOC109242158 n=1 Tax=Nicotiana attenuata TaxID=49451 RepID=UPI000905C42A|nr:PREDICTED: uncharacterized protein LOC109242158 [Nicotiana attenuata]